MSTKCLSIRTNYLLTSQTTSTLPQAHLIKLPFPQTHKPFPLLVHSKSHIPNCQNPQNPPTPLLEGKLKDTQEAISLFLQELGLPREESDTVAFNSPRYAAMLLDSVKDLEEWNEWSSSGSGAGGGGEGGRGKVGFGDMGFKEKVVYMAKEKGDGGKVAFLESVGLSLNSSMNVARYLSKESLPGLIQKVKYIKDILFSGSDDSGVLGKNACRMMMHLSIFTDEDLQQTLSFFEKIAARRGGLDLLGSSDASFGYLVESFPQILLLTINSHLKPMTELFESIGVPKQCLRNILILFPPILISDIKHTKRKLDAFSKVGAFDRSLGKMLLKYPWILSTSVQDNYKEILSFFDIEKVPKASVEEAIRGWPYLLGCSTSKLKVIVDQIGELGVKDQKLGKVIAKSPQLLLRKPQELLEVVSFLEDLGFDRESVGKILARCPEMFGANIGKNLKKKVEFLTSIGVSEDHLPRVIKKYPGLLISDVNTTLLPRMNYLMEIGLSKRDVAFMVRRFSPLLGYSIEEVLRPKYEFLVNTMKKPVKDVVDYPRYFSYSLENKIKPRFWVLKGRNVKCSLKDMLHKNDEEFAVEFMGVESIRIPPFSSSHSP